MVSSAERQQRRATDTAAARRLERVYRYADLSAYTLRQRLLIRAAASVFYFVIKLVGRTVRFEVEGWEHWEAIERGGHLPIFVMWHNRAFLGTYWWRGRRIVVLISRSFDGEYIARFVQRFGFGAARGSSTRGGARAVIEMTRLMRAGCPAAFTPDGPKGPPYVAKMGPVLLAKKSGQPMLPMTVAAERYWELPSWDSFQVPKPFTRARVRLAAPIYVPADADDEALEAKRAELQRALDEINR